VNLILLVLAMNRNASQFFPENEKISTDFEDEQNYIVEVGVQVMHICSKAAFANKNVDLFKLSIECKAMLRRKIWSCTSESMKIQKKEMEEAGTAVPKVIATDVAIETWGEDNILPDDVVTATITINRVHAESYKGPKKLIPSEESPVCEGEPWWLVLGAKNHWYGATTLNVSDLSASEVKGQIKFSAPSSVGRFMYELSILSPSFVGVNAEVKGSFKVDKK